MPLRAPVNDLKSSDPPVCVEEKTLELFNRRTIAGQVDRRDLGQHVIKIFLPLVVVLIWAHKPRLQVEQLGRILASIRDKSLHSVSYLATSHHIAGASTARRTIGIHMNQAAPAYSPLPTL